LLFACDLAAAFASAASAYSGGRQKVRHYTIGGAGDCKARPGVLRCPPRGIWCAHHNYAFFGD
jgi:hypothetical protein